MPSEATTLLPKAVPTSTNNISLSTAPPFPHTRHAAYVLIVLAAVCNSFSSLFIHLAVATHNLPTTSAAIIRSVVGTLLSVPAVMYVRPPWPSSPHLLIPRAILGSIALICSYAALKRIPVGVAVTIINISPVITSALCAVALGESLRQVDLLALIASFAGVAMVAQPKVEMNALQGTALFGVLLALSCAVLQSMAYTLVRKMSISVHTLYHVLSVSIGVGVLSMSSWRTSDIAAIETNVTGTVLMAIASLLGFLGMVTFNAGLQRCRACEAMVIKSLSVPLSFLWGWIFLGETGGWVVWGGVAMVLSSGISVALGDDNKKKGASQEMKEDLDKLPSMDAEGVLVATGEDDK